MKTLLLILDLRKAWKSKTLTFGRLLALLPVLDLTFFGGGTGLTIVEWLTKGINALPVLPDFSVAQIAVALVTVIGWVVAYLRSLTTVPLSAKL